MPSASSAVGRRLHLPGGVLDEHLLQQGIVLPVQGQSGGPTTLCGFDRLTYLGKELILWTNSRATPDFTDIHGQKWDIKGWSSPCVPR